MRREDALLSDIAHAAGLTAELIRGRDFDSFIADIRTYWAVISQIMIVGEAVKGLSQPFRSAHPSIRWSDIARMRDKLIHHYNDIDAEEVWESAARDIPHILRYLQPLLPEEDK
jgi:uncharacterized protein with HEPN domain